MQSPSSLSTFFLLLLCALLCNGWDLQVTEPRSLAKNYDIVARLDVLPEEFDVTGRAVAADPVHACSTLRNADQLNGTIVFIKDTTRCSPQQKARFVSEVAGVLGMVVVMSDGSVGSGFNYGESRDDSTWLPSVEIASNLGSKLMKNIEEEDLMIVRIKTPDNNPWMTLTWGPAGILFQLTFAFCSIGTFCFSAWKWSQFITVQSFQFNVPQICLGLETLAALIRCLYFIQPLRFTKFFYSEWFYGIIERVTMTISFTTTLLITFYWHQALQSMRQKKDSGGGALPDLGKLRIPFLVVIAIMWLFEFIAAVMRAGSVDASGDIVLIGILFDILISLFSIVFFSITGVRIINVLKATANLNGKRGAKGLRMITLFVTMSSIGLVGYLLAISLFISTVNQESPSLSLFVWTMVWASLFLVSFPQIAAFQGPPSDSSMSSPESSKKTPNETPLVTPMP